MKRTWSFLALLGALAGCAAPADSGAGAGTFPAAALMRLTSSSGSFAVEVRTSPSQPPSRGEGSVELRIVDASTSDPATGLDLSILPWMPAMGHGTSVTPEVDEADPGRYVVSRVDLFMPGVWQLRTKIDGGGGDSFVPTFDVP